MTPFKHERMTPEQIKRFNPLLAVLVVFTMMGVAVGMVIMLLVDWFGIKDAGPDNLPPFLGLLVIMVIMLATIHSVRPLAILIMRNEAGMKDALRTVWEDSDGNDIPGKPLVRESEKVYPHRINADALDYLAGCASPILLVALLFYIIIDGPLLDGIEPNSIEGFAVMIALLLVFIAAYYASIYIMAWAMRKNPYAIRAMLEFEEREVTE